MKERATAFGEVIPKAVAEHAHAIGISYQRMVTTDSGLRVEYLDDRVYSAPSAHNALDWTLCLASPRCPPGAHAEGTGAAALCPCYVLLSPLISL